MHCVGFKFGAGPFFRRAEPPIPASGSFRASGGPSRLIPWNGHGARYMLPLMPDSDALSVADARRSQDLEVERLVWTRQRLYDSVIVDVEGACNLRCVYCYQSDPAYVPHKGMSDAVLDLSILFAKTYGVGSINLTALGEFTHAKNWRAMAERILSAGVALGCTTNLARLLDDGEIELFSRFSMICVSLDTADRETLRALRRSADIRTIAHNALRIRAAAAIAGRRPPHMIVNAVLTSGNALRLAELAAYCFSLGIGGVHLSPLNDSFDFKSDKTQAEGATVADPIEAWDEERLKRLYAELLAAIEIARKMGGFFHVAPAIGQRIEARLNRTGVSNVVPPGMTRLCLQPWDRALVGHDGALTPCCYGVGPVGNIATDGIDGTVHGPKLAALRRALVTGENLPDACRNCSGERVGTVEAQRALVKAHIDAH